MMQSFGSLGAFLLAAVFFYAAVTKLMAPTRTSSEFQGLGLRFAGPLARLVPLVEGVVAIWLITTPRLAGPTAAVVLVLFTGVLVNAIRQGRTVSCGCLGSLTPEPISYRTVARNGFLLSLAALASAIDDPTVPGLVPVMITGSVVVLGLVGTQLVLLRSTVGPLWHLTFAGEQVPDDQQRASHQPNGHRLQNQAVQPVLDVEIDLDLQVERLVRTNDYSKIREV